MLNIFHAVLHVITFCLIMYLLYGSFIYKASQKKITKTSRSLVNMQILMDLSEQGWIISKRSVKASDKGWVIEKASFKFCDILGYNWISEYDNEVVGMSKDELVSVYPMGKTYNKDQTVSIYLNKLRKKDGKEIWVETSGKTVFSEAGEKRISVIKNVEHIISKFKE